jgi:mono/diheme cytochrome c family protein
VAHNPNPKPAPEPDGPPAAGGGGVTDEFEIIYATLADPREVTQSENPRDTLSDEELAEHVKGLESVVRARTRALAAED